MDQPQKDMGHDVRIDTRDTTTRLQQLELIFNTSIDIIFLMTVEPGDRYRFTSVNDAFLSTTGLKREQVEGKYVTEVIPPSSLALVLAKYKQAIEERQTVQWEEVSQYPAGNKTGIVSITPVFNAQQQCVSLVGMVHDITGRKRTEEENEHNRYLLNERVKELTTLYRASQIFQSETKTIAQALGELVVILPGGWQYPDITEARIVFDKDVYTTSSFSATIYKQSAKFKTLYGIDGTIEVGYTQERPAESEGPFLTEERNLIDMVAEMLRIYIDRKKEASQLLMEKELSESIINSLPGIFYLQEITGELLNWNRQLEIVTGYSGDEIAQRHTIDFFDENDRQFLLKRSNDVYLNGEADAEVTVITKTGARIPYYFTGRLIEYKGRPCIIGTGIDIAERKEAAERLRRQKELSESIINSLPGVFYLFDENGKYLLWNKNHETIPGYSHEEMQAMYPLNFFEGVEKDTVAERIRRVFEEGYAEVEANFIGKNGSKIPFYFNGVAINYEGKRCLMGVGIDITERKVLERRIMNQKVEEQKKMTRAVLNAQEKERNKIGQELHDNVNQILAGSKMLMGLMKAKKVGDDELIDKSIALIDSAINEIRILTRDQVTPQLKIDLYDLVRPIVENLNEHTSIDADFVYDMNGLTVEDDLKLNVYRIVQEGVNNAIKHAQAKQVTVVIKGDHDGLHVVITDDGKGFDSTVTMAKGVGMSNMQNRVESYNGWLLVESSPGKGCRIELNIPI